jgi:hypothetical protein
MLDNIMQTYYTVCKHRAFHVIIYYKDVIERKFFPDSKYATFIRVFINRSMPEIEEINGVLKIIKIDQNSLVIEMGGFGLTGSDFEPPSAELVAYIQNELDKFMNNSERLLEFFKELYAYSMLFNNRELARDLEALLY